MGLHQTRSASSFTDMNSRFRVETKEIGVVVVVVLVVVVVVREFIGISKPRNPIADLKGSLTIPSMVNVSLAVLAMRD